MARTPVYGGWAGLECSTHTWNMPPSLSTPQISPYVCFFFPLALCLSRQGVLESDLAVCCVATLKYCSYHLNGMPRYAHIGHPVMLTILLSTRHPYPPPSFSHCTFVGNMRRQFKKLLQIKQIKNLETHTAVYSSKPHTPWVREMVREMARVAGKR